MPIKQTFCPFTLIGVLSIKITSGSYDFKSDPLWSDPLWSDLDFKSDPLWSDLDFKSDPLWSDLDFKSDPLWSDLDFKSNPLWSDLDFKSDPLWSDLAFWLVTFGKFSHTVNSFLSDHFVNNRFVPQSIFPSLHFSLKRPPPLSNRVFLHKEWSLKRKFTVIHL